MGESRITSKEISRIGVNEFCMHLRWQRPACYVPKRWVTMGLNLINMVKPGQGEYRKEGREIRMDTASKRES